MTKRIATAPNCDRLEAGMTLVELVIYLAILSVVLIAVYQLRGLMTASAYRSFNISADLANTSMAMEKITQEVRKTQSVIRLFDQAQDSGAPVGSGTKNCIEMDRLIRGNLVTFSITMRWNNSSKAFQPFFLKDSGCATAPTSSNAVALSEPIFQQVTGKDFFTPASALESTGYREVNFNYKTSMGSGALAGGINQAATRLSANSPTPHDCRVASPDKSWFTDYGTSLIRTVIVSITLNPDTTNDRVRLLGSRSNVTATPFDSLGVLHLFATDGLTVADWLTVLGDVQYTRASGAPAITTDTLPKRFTFSLGEGLPYTPGGIPSSHFYFAVKFDSAQNFLQANTFAKRICYPSFKTNPATSLGQGATTAGTSCDSLTPPRLTGHLATLSTEGEHELVRTKVLNMVYPQTQPANSSSAPFGNAFSSGSTSPSTGSAWLGGEYNNGTYNWIRGFETACTGYQFANASRTAQNNCGAAGLYFVSLFNNSTGTNGYKVYFDIAGNNETPKRYWNTDVGGDTDAASDTSGRRNDYAIIEFGDNRGSGSSSSPAEGPINSNIKLKKDIMVLPYEFFNTCKM